MSAETGPLQGAAHAREIHRQISERTSRPGPVRVETVQGGTCSGEIKSFIIDELENPASADGYLELLTPFRSYSLKYSAITRVY